MDGKDVESKTNLKTVLSLSSAAEHTQPIMK